MEKKIRKTLRYSMLDGAFYSAMVGFGESFFSTFAVFLKATSLQLGLLSALPQTIGSLSQLYSERILERFNSRKKMVLLFAGLQGLVILPIMLMFLWKTLQVYHLIILVCIYWIFGMLISPVWSSWMGDLVPEEIRGRYFSRRSRIAGIIMFVTFIIGGYILQQYANRHTEYIGFAILFSLAIMARGISVFYLFKKFEPEYKHNHRPQDMLSFLRKAKEENYGQFVIYIILMNLAVYIASPFFTPYMLNELKFSYLTFTIATGAMIIAKYLVMPIWGKLSDKYGTKKIMTLSGFMMPLVPLLWFFSGNFYYILAIQIYSGIAWAGFELASFNFIFDTTRSEDRVRYVSYYNVINGFAILVGSIIGGILIKYPSIFASGYMFIFILSFALRYMTSIIFLPLLKESRKVKEITEEKLLWKLFSNISLRNTVFDIVHFKRK